MSVKRETQAEIRALEERLANPGPTDTESSLAPIFGDDFREFGSSGRVFDARTVLGALGTVAQRRNRGIISLEGFKVARVAANVVLATYLARIGAADGKPPSLRSSLWCRRDGRWQIVFHQGTPVPPGPPP